MPVPVTPSTPWPTTVTRLGGEKLSPKPRGVVASATSAATTAAPPWAPTRQPGGPVRSPPRAPRGAAGGAHQRAGRADPERAVAIHRGEETQEERGAQGVERVASREERPPTAQPAPG